MTAVEENDTPPHAIAAAPDQQSAKTHRKHPSDQGPEVLPDMEHFVMLARKAKRPAFILRLLEQARGDPLPEIAALLEGADSMLPAPSRKVLFQAVSEMPRSMRQGLEAAAERVVLLDDEHGEQAVRSLLDEQESGDAALLVAPSDRYSRALYLYLRQEYPETGARADRRFDHAEHLQIMHRQWKSEHFSSHYLGPKGVVPKIDARVEAALHERIAALYPRVPSDEIVVEHFTRRDLAHADRSGGEDIDEVAPVVLHTLTAAFNGSEVHFEKVQGGEVVCYDDEAAMSASFSWEPESGALGVFSEDREHRRELVRDVVLACDGAISDMPIREFDLLCFATPEILKQLDSKRVGDVEKISILHVKVARPFEQRTTDEARGRDIIQRLSSTLIVGRDRRDARNVYQVAYEDYGLGDLRGYVLSQVKLVVRMAQQTHRKAHNVAVQITAPNGLNDRSKTEDDRERVLAQLARLGVLREF
jgi:hypothetical protein